MIYYGLQILNISFFCKCYNYVIGNASSWSTIATIVCFLGIGQALGLTVGVVGGQLYLKLFWR